MTCTSQCIQVVPRGGGKPVAERLLMQFVGDLILDEPNPDVDPSQFTLEANYFSDCILQDKTPKTAGEEGLLDMQYMSKIYESCGLPAL